MGSYASGQNCPRRTLRANGRTLGKVVALAHMSSIARCRWLACFNRVKIRLMGSYEVRSIKVIIWHEAETSGSKSTIAYQRRQKAGPNLRSRRIRYVHGRCPRVLLYQIACNYSTRKFAHANKRMMRDWLFSLDKSTMCIIDLRGLFRVYVVWVHGT